MPEQSISRRWFLQSAAAEALAVTVPALTAAAPAVESLQKKGAGKKVIVVGGGLAGLVAAYELNRAGHGVTILEASLRAGGRVYTLRQPFSDGLYTEAGAVYLPDSHHYTMHYVRHFNLPVVAFPRERVQFCHLGGKRIDEQPGKETAWPLPLSKEEHQLGRGGMYAKYIVPLFQESGDPLATGWPSADLKKYDQMSFAELLEKRGASPAARFLLSLGYLQFWGEGLETLSALSVLRDLAVTMKSMQQQFYIKGGNDQLPKAFASRLSDKMHYGSPVSAIRQDAKGVRVTVRRDGEERSFDADQVICTVPFPVIGAIAVTPELSAAKRRAIQELPYTSVTRIFLQSRTRFWSKEGKVPLNVNTDLPIMSVYDGAFDEPGPRGLLNCYMAGTRARTAGGMSETDRLTFALESLKKIFPEMRENYEGGASYCWDQNPWSQGAYSWLKPGQMTSLLPHISAPEGRIHFAGEHTSPWPGWMQGALQSGHRAAKEVNDAA
jgi:monoamine oxidase